MDIKLIIKELKYKKNLTQEAIGKELGVTKSTVNQLASGLMKPSTELLAKITKLCLDNDISIYDNIVSEPQEQYGNPKPKPIPVNKGVPIYDFDFAAGLSMFSTNDIQLSEHILGYMNFPEFMGADAIVKIKGDSMTGKLEDGDWVTVRKQKSVDIINYGSIYGIITTDDMPLIKIIRKGSTDDTVLLRSNNPEYEDYEIPKAKIQALFQFLGKATIKGITN